jgi:putative CocE/NonD family hydrolase
MRKRIWVFRPWLVVLLCGICAAALAQDKNSAAFVTAHYTKYEYFIPMRDGAHLFTAVYVPKPEAFADHGSWPFLMTRTPYGVGPYGDGHYRGHLGPSDEFEKAGYIFVYQDVRGRFMSEGRFVEMTPAIDHKTSNQQTDESSDTYDTIEFLLKHVPDNNGKVGIVGISYPGFYTSASIINSHPAIKAASPQAPMTNLFIGADDSYHGGAFMLAANFGFYAGFFHQFNGPATEEPPARSVDIGPDSYRFYLNAGPLSEMEKKYLGGSNALYLDQMQHDTYDHYWQIRDLSQHMIGVHAAVLTVGGWFDAEDLTGPLKTFHAIGKFNPGITNTVVIGPWVHGGWAYLSGDHLGDVQFGAKTAEYFRAQIQFPFFEYYLKGRGSSNLPKAYVFETGTNVWRKYSAWPPPGVHPRMLYFHQNGTLSFAPPTAAEGHNQYVSDPTHPVPFVGYTTNDIPQRYMDDDQRFAARRPDVLVYESAPLQGDVTIAGPISPKLKIASSGTDSDFIVKLIDVYPKDFPNPEEDNEGKHVIDAPPLQMGGYEQLVRGEPMRAKFRHSWEKPEPLVPGRMTELDFTMPDVNHTFRKGHRIMVQVQSSWFPLVDRNPQTFVDIPYAKPGDFKKATEQVFCNQKAASGVEVMVLPQP